MEFIRSTMTDEMSMDSTLLQPASYICSESFELPHPTIRMLQFLGTGIGPSNNAFSSGYSTYQSKQPLCSAYRLSQKLDCAYSSLEKTPVLGAGSFQTGSGSSFRFSLFRFHCLSMLRRKALRYSSISSVGCIVNKIQIFEMLRPPADNPNNQSRMSQQSGKQRIFETQRNQYVSNLKPSIVNQQSYASKFQSAGEVIQVYQIQPLQVDQYQVQFGSVRPSDVKQSRVMQVDDSQIKSSNRLHELLRHSTNPANMESLMALFRLQKPLALTLPSQRATGQSQVPRSTLNNQIPAYYSNYYSQLDAEAERVRERVKEEAKVVQFIIEKHRRSHEQHERIKRESEEVTQKLMEYHKQHKQKVFKKQAKYTFQLMESKTDELKDFYEEMYNLMELFGVAAHEQSRATTNVLTLSKAPKEDQEILQQLIGEGPEQADKQINLAASQASKNGDSSESAGIEMQSYAVKLFSDLQHYAKQIETTLSQQRRTQNVSQNNQEFKQLSQSLLQELQGYPAQEAKSFKELNHLYVLNYAYYQLVAKEARDFLLHQNSLLGELRNAISSIDQLHYIHSKFNELTPQVAVYYEVLDKLLQENDLTKIDPNSLPHPKELNQQVLTKLSQLHQQFKQSHTSSQTHKHFKNVRLKVFRKNSESIQKQKETARDTHSLQCELQEFVRDTINSENEADRLYGFVQGTVEELQTKLTSQGIQQMTDYFHQLNVKTTDLQMRQRKAGSLRTKCDDPHYLSIIDILEKTLDPILKKLQQCGEQVDSYVSLGDLQALIDFQELSELIHIDEPKIAKYITDQVGHFEIKMSTCIDTKPLEDQMNKVKRRVQASQGRITEIEALLQRDINDTIKSQIQVILSKWNQIQETFKGLEAIQEAAEYLTKQNIETLSHEFSETDRSTPIAQFEELCAEQMKKLLEQTDHCYDICWTAYRPYQYEALINIESDGFQWIGKLIQRLLQFQQSLQGLFPQQPQHQPKPASGNYFDQQSEEHQQDMPAQSIVLLEHFLQTTYSNPITDPIALLYTNHPSNYRWMEYERLLTHALLDIIHKYYKNIFEKMGTLGGGLNLFVGQFDADKAEKVKNWFNTLNPSAILESAIEVLLGESFSQPDEFENLIEYLIVVFQIKGMVKDQLQKLQSRQHAPPRSNQGSQQDIQISQDDLGNNYKNYDESVQSVSHSIETFQKGIAGLQMKMRFRIIDPNQLQQEQPKQEQAELLTPLISYLLLILDDGNNVELKQLILYMNIQSTWINQTIRYFSKPVPIMEPDLIDRVHQVYSILQGRLFDSQKIKELLELTQITSLQKTYLSESRDTVEAALLKDHKVQDIQDLCKFMDALKTFSNLDRISQSIVNAIGEMERVYILPLEKEKKLKEPKLTYVPQTFIDQLYFRLNTIKETCETIHNYIIATNMEQQMPPITQVGIIKLDGTALLKQQNLIYRWGLICQQIRNRLFPGHDEARQDPQVDFEQIDDKSFQATQSQQQLEIVIQGISD